MIIFSSIIYVFKLCLDDDIIKKYKENILMKDLIKYFILSFCFIPEIIRKRNMATKGIKENKLNIKFGFKDILIFIFILIILLIGNFFDCLTKKYQNEILFFSSCNFSIFFLVMFISSMLVYNISFYKHQFISVIIIILFGIIRYMILAIKYGEFSSYNSLIFGFFFNIIYNTCESLGYGFIKKFGEKTYFSPYKICYMIGLINFFIILIIYFTISYIPYNKENEFFSFKYDERFYFDNIYGIFYKYNFLQFIGLFFYYLIYPFAFILFNIILQKYTICHIFFPFQAYEFFYNMVKYKSYPIILFIFCIIGIFELFITLVFLEIIELNFCGLNTYIKRNIQLRAIEDINDNDDLIKEEKEENNIIELDGNYITKIGEEKEEE
jgi:hypothetical protein